MGYVIMENSRVSIRPYGKDDLWLMEKTLGDPTQMIYLNGSESEERIRRRHHKRITMSANPQTGCQYTILTGANNDPAGNIGYWESEWKGQKGWEMGWFVLPEFQGHGIATAASRQVIQLLIKRKNYTFIFATPSVDNQPSNAICRKLGFTLTGEDTIEYPSGSGRLLKINCWTLTLPTEEI